MAKNVALYKKIGNNVYQVFPQTTADLVSYDNSTVGAKILDFGTRISALETAVGSSSSGLVKDVDDLQTTVGDSTSGLVKDVAELQAAVAAIQANYISQYVESNQNNS